MVNGISPGAYAKRRGCQTRAVQVAIETGRLSASVRREGRRWFIDPKAADVEWEATTRTDGLPSYGPTAPRSPAMRPLSLAEARARLDTAKAVLAELDLAERRGELLRAADVEAEVANSITRSKTKLLGVPARARQQDPTLTPAQLQLLDDLIREALEDLAGEAPAAQRRKRKAAVEARA